MAIFRMIFRKMFNNKWLELSLLLGLVLTVALVSSIPIYTHAILNRMLVKELEGLQLNNDQYPGVFWFSAHANPEQPREQQAATLQGTENYLSGRVLPAFQIPAHYAVEELTSVLYNLSPVDEAKADPSVKRRASFGAFSDMEGHIQLIDGRMPQDQAGNGVYEALVTSSSLDQLNMVLGTEFHVLDDEGNALITILPVGVINKLTDDDLYWYTKNLNSYNDTFFLSEDVLKTLFFTEQKLTFKSAYWYVPLDYHKMTLETIDSYLQASRLMTNHLYQNYENYDTLAAASGILYSYNLKQQRLTTLLWSLMAPVMIMLACYLFMVALLITESQKTEIALMRSRGASRLHVLAAYLIEGCILGGLAVICGPPLGMLFTSVLGASDGFMNFVNRAALDVALNKQAYVYAGYTALFSILTTLIPVFFATRVTIVERKKQMARSHVSSLWKKLFLDVILLAVSLYGLRQFRANLADLQAMGLDHADFTVDPMLFIVPAVFVIGLGLLMLRIYPWLVRLIYFIGKRWWPPSLYFVIIQVGRSIKQYQFLMIFLIMTLATGLFNAGAARTLNQNASDQIQYAQGADVVLQTRWENNAPLMSGMGEEEPDESQTNSAGGETPVIQYMEPPFQPIRQLAGVEHAAKVFVKDGVTATVQKNTEQVKLMGIVTDEFGEASWFRNGLLSYHLFDYLNVLGSEPSAVLISRSVSEQLGVRVGDEIGVGWRGIDPASFVVYGILDYFPSFNPNIDARRGANAKPPMLIVGNLPYIQNNLALEPYQVWIQLSDDGSAVNDLSRDIEEKRIPITAFHTTKEDILKLHNDPFQMSINGVMTLGFLISVIISFFGFLLYWVLSLRSRTLQLGIFRAMGISFRQLIGMLIAEQLLTSGAAVLIGVVTGRLTSQLFVPMFQIAFDTSGQIIPFKVIGRLADYILVYGMVGVMIVWGLVILGFLLSRIRIHQAVKLGEDS